LSTKSGMRSTGKTSPMDVYHANISIENDFKKKILSPLE